MWYIHLRKLPEASGLVEYMKTWTSFCPFDQWGMDIVGPFPVGPNQRKFLLVTVDYFSKCVEAEALVTITEEAVIKFL